MSGRGLPHATIRLRRYGHCVRVGNCTAGVSPVQLNTTANSRVGFEDAHVESQERRKHHNTF